MILIKYLNPPIPGGFFVILNYMFFGGGLNSSKFVQIQLTLHAFMRLITCILLASVVLASCSQFSKVQKSTDYEYKLRMAEQYYAKKKYNYAQLLFEELFPIVKGTPQFEDVYYKYAYCAYYQRDYMNAENLFKGFVE